MDGALGWFSSLMESIGHIFPRWLHVEANELAVMFTRGNALALGPGMHWYWPVWSRPHKQVVARQTYTLETQTLTTSDCRTVCARAQVVVTISDAMLAFAGTATITEAIVDVSLNAVKAVVSSRSLMDLLENSQSIDKELSGQLKTDLKPFGVSVIRAFLSDFSPAIALCNIRD